MVTCESKCSGGVTCGVPAPVWASGSCAVWGLGGREAVKERYRGVHWFKKTCPLVSREEDGLCRSDLSMFIEGTR